MSIVQFAEELRRLARYDRLPPAASPLAAAVEKVKENPALAQSRLLSRILAALTYQRGEFRRAEASALDAPTLSLVVSLLNAARAGNTPREQWTDAVSACETAAAE